MDLSTLDNSIKVHDKGFYVRIGSDSFANPIRSSLAKRSRESFFSHAR